MMRGYAALCIYSSMILALLLGATTPLPVHGQIGANQIQVSGADARGDFDLEEPLELSAMYIPIPPSIVVVGADAIALLEFEEMNGQAEQAKTAETAGRQSTAFFTPTYAIIQVTNADAIGRFTLQPIEATSPGRSQTATASQSSTSTRATLPSVRIQVTNADAIGNYALQPLDWLRRSATKTGQSDTPSTDVAPIAGERAQVATDGQLNVRSGPGRQFDIVGQLEAGAEVTVLAQSEDDAWLLVMADDGLTGWVATRSMTLP